MSYQDTDDVKTTSMATNQVANVNWFESEPFESQLSPSPSPCGKYDDRGDCKWQYSENTLLLNDNTPMEDALENQAVVLVGETQPLDDIDGVEDINTQLLDEIGVEDINTQLLDEIGEEVVVDRDDEGTDRNQVLDNVNDLYAYDGQSAGSNENPCELLCGHGVKKLLMQTDTVIDEQTSSGPKPPRFTFLCAEYLQHAALAARNMASTQAKGETLPVIDTSQSRESLSVKDGEPGRSERVKEVDQEYEGGKWSGEVGEFMDKNKLKVGSSAMRKLFNDELPAEKKVPSRTNDVTEGEDLGKLPVYDAELAGLSYVDSEERGELSQANAPDFIDRFLKDNIMELDQEGNCVKNLQEKSKSLSRHSTEGQRSLAKRANDRSKAGKTGIYDWYDSLEDDRGGDIFLRRKDKLFEGESCQRKSLPGVLKVNVSKPNDYEDGEDELTISNKRMNAACSDSRLMLQNVRARDHSIQETDTLSGLSGRNLDNGFDKQLNVNPSRGQLESDGMAADAQEMLGVGLDTQMAAEAMEALCNGEGTVIRDANGSIQATRSGLTDSTNCFSSGKTGAITSTECFRQYARKRKLSVELDLQTSSSSKRYIKKVKQLCDKNNLMKRSKRSKLNAEDNLNSIAGENNSNLPSGIKQRKSTGDSKIHQVEELNNCTGRVGGNNVRSVHKRHLQGGLCYFTPIACRTRRSLVINQLGKLDRLTRSFREEDRIGYLEKRNSSISFQEPKALNPKSTIVCSDHFGRDDLEKSASKFSTVHNGSIVVVDELEVPRRRRSLRKLSCHVKGTKKLGSSSKSATGCSGHFRVDGNAKFTQLEKYASKFRTIKDGSTADALKVPRRRRSLRKLSFHNKGSEKLDGLSKPSALSEDIGNSNARKGKMRTDARSVAKSNKNGQTRASSHSGSIASSIDRKRGKMLEPIIHKTNLRDISLCYSIGDKDANLNSDGKNDANFPKSVYDMMLDELPRERCKSFDLASSTLAKFKVTTGDALPVFMSNDYYKQSCNKNISRSCRELQSLCAVGPEIITPSNNSRKRRDLTDVQVLFSRHLDEDIIKHQKKILVRLGASVVSSISDATHFVADEFVRTRNMLEAIASGKPVVSHLWIESCGQACCFIDEKNYILRDAKKEKEFGFSMPVSLARASQCPLLKGRGVLITPNAKPSKEIISSLVKAVQGQAVERIVGSVMKAHEVPDDLLVLSCEDDYTSCVPFLNKGITAYSSELLLSGILTHKLEYERHRLFAKKKDLNPLK